VTKTIGDEVIVTFHDRSGLARIDALGTVLMSPVRARQLFTNLLQNVARPKPDHITLDLQAKSGGDELGLASGAPG
jgi:class 3 adenylate cyclase